jgi:ankyrin repeat protein
VFTADEDKLTQLSEGVLTGSVDTVKRLIASKAARDEPINVGKWSPLMMACAFGYSEIALLLLIARCSTTYVDCRGQTALMLATYGGYANIVSAIIRASTASVNFQRRSTGETALQIGACGWIYHFYRITDDRQMRRYLENRSYQMLAVVYILLDAGGDVNEAGEPLLCLAAKSGIPLLVKALVQMGGASVNVCNKQEKNCTPLLYATNGGHVEVVDFLLQSRANVNAYVNGTTSLMIASQKDYVNIVPLLLQAGARVDFQSPVWGFTALMYSAAFGRDIEVLKQLIQVGADLDVRIEASNIGDEEIYKQARATKLPFTPQSTALSIACATKTKKCNNMFVITLLRAGASPHVYTEKGYTALADKRDCCPTHRESARLFLVLGAELSIFDKRKLEEKLQDDNVRASTKDAIRRFTEECDDMIEVKKGVVVDILQYHVLIPEIWNIVFSYTKIPGVMKHFPKNN